MVKARHATAVHALVLSFISGCATDSSTGPAVGGNPGPLEQPAPAPTVPPDTARPATQWSSAFIWSADRGVRQIPAPSGYDLIATDINDRGEVTGMVVAGQRYIESFIWSEAEGLRRFGSLNGFEEGGVIVTGINSSGTVVGYQHAFTGSRIRAFLASAGAGLSPLSDQDMWAGGINDAGTIVGSSREGPFLFKPDKGFQSLPVTAAECTVATAINDANEVIGWSGNELYGMGCVPQAWIVWRGMEAPVEIATCPSGCSLDLIAFNDHGVAAGHDGAGAVRMATRGVVSIQRMPGMGASDINDLGDVAGTARDSGQPVIWTSAGELFYLPLPAGKSKGTARAINNRGEVVGVSW